MHSDTFARYAASNVPRYTSYPTAPAFSPEVGEDAYRTWLASLDGGADASVYIHVPFCRAMCLYCGCHTTVTRREEPVERYLAALALEIDLVRAATPAPPRIGHLHFGGGSPTLIPPVRMIELVAQLRRCFGFAPDAEIAIEVDPRTLTEEMASALGTCGFTRASIGVQSFDPIVQRAIRRVQSFETTATAVRWLRGAGIERVNVDLIYGLPHQTVSACAETVEQSLEVRPDRFAVFGYAHVPDFKPHQRKLDPASLPDFAARLEQAAAIGEALRRAGYLEIGLDHFARPDDPLAEALRTGTLRRNFQGYTTDTAETLIGLGASSISRTKQGFVQNAVLISEYLKHVAKGRLPVARGYALTEEDTIRAAIIERIMCHRRVDLAGECARFGWDPDRVTDQDAIDTLVADGLVRKCGSVIEVTEPAHSLVRWVAAAFDGQLAHHRQRYSRAV
ncbi:MAG: oxygen-independent coproporphyrinogen III oxidase [Qipengyuania sp.]|jgi:oxygen-independent coproporphyrinogen III oxidase|nr:oxygen-independent coproporphyrinogen III oxidase [Qipengyuania sp.]